LGENANKLFQNEFMQKEKDGKLGAAESGSGVTSEKEWLIKSKDR
jgi:hypothetical protein